ncbi:Transposon Ty1-NL2 Gag-Pol polyprotein, partial [Durusdinium trenchii]
HLSLTVIAQRDWKLESLDLKTAFLQTGVRILRNVYGNADAPRELWRDVDTKLKSIGAHRLTDRGQLFLDLGHVDDFMRAGDLSNDTWLKIRKNIDELYAWGSKKEENFRYTGLNVEVVNKNKERYVELNQDCYLEDLPPLAISDERLRLDPKTSLTDGEM